MRYRDILIEGTPSLLAAEPIGTIVQMAPESDFGATIWAMKMASGEWHRVAQVGYQKGVEQYTYDGTPISEAVLDAALSQKRLSRPLEGIHPGDRIRNGVQVLALPIGATVVNPQTGSQYEKTQSGMLAPTGAILDHHVFNSENAMWQ